jgi:hypothetical protein
MGGQRDISLFSFYREGAEAQGKFDNTLKKTP